MYVSGVRAGRSAIAKETTRGPPRREGLYRLASLHLPLPSSLHVQCQSELALFELSQWRNKTSTGGSNSTLKPKAFPLAFLNDGGVATAFRIALSAFTRHCVHHRAHHPLATLFYRSIRTPLPFFLFLSCWICKQQNYPRASWHCRVAYIPPFLCSLSLPFTTLPRARGHVISSSVRVRGYRLFEMQVPAGKQKAKVGGVRWVHCVGVNTTYMPMFSELPARRRVPRHSKLMFVRCRQNLLELPKDPPLEGHGAF